jgi:hypothetical protein
LILFHEIAVSVVDLLAVSGPPQRDSTDLTRALVYEDRHSDRGL